MFKVEIEGMDEAERDLRALETPEGVAQLLNEHHRELVCPTHGSSPELVAHGRDGQGNATRTISFCCDELRALYDAEMASDDEGPVNLG